MAEDMGPTGPMGPHRGEPLGKDRPIPPGPGPITPPPRMSTAELARNVVTNIVWIASPGAPGWDAFDAFFQMAIGQLFADGHTEAELQEWGAHLGAAWERIGSAGPMAVNGCPMFLSIHFVNIADMPELRRLLAAKEGALGAG